MQGALAIVVMLSILLIGVTFSGPAESRSGLAPLQARQDPSFLAPQNNGANSSIEVYPASSFSLQGHLNTTSGVPIANATISIEAFNSVTNTTTNSRGQFSVQLLAPANATDGIHEISIIFGSKGPYAPSSAFAFVDVVREPLNVSVSVPQFFVSGFRGSIRGVALANGSALPNANITISSPWGVFHTRTDGLGNYNVSFVMPIDYLAFGGQIAVSVTPTQPYIESTQSFASATVFNPVEVGFLVLVLGLTIVGVKNLGLLSSMRTRRELVQQREKPKRKPLKEAVAIQEPLLSDYRPRMAFIYEVSLSLASNKFKRNFPSSLTLRETISEISELDRGLGAELFSSIALAAEDLFYARRFKISKMDDAEASLARLKDLWK